VTLVKKIVCFSKIHVTSLLGVLLIICITQGRMRLNWQVLLTAQTKKFTRRLQILAEAEHPNGMISVAECDKISPCEFLPVKYKHWIARFFCWSHCRECSIQMNTDMPRCRSLLFFEMPVWNVLENVILGWRCFITVLSVV
jgi:hypothetical protein